MKTALRFLLTTAFAYLALTTLVLISCGDDAKDAPDAANDAAGVDGSSDGGSDGGSDGSADVNGD